MSAGRDEAKLLAGDGLTLIGPLAYRGKVGCRDPRCTTLGQDRDSCYGWHCSYCDAPCSSQGHRCDAATALLEASARTAPGEDT